MESLIQISKINDFLFCPRSLYFHSVYENFSDVTYHSSAQTRGRFNHTTIDTGTYESEKKFLQGLEVYTEKYGLIGKIDLYDKEKKILIERKSKISFLHKGYFFQMYAQYFSLEEMGFPVEKMVLRSLTDNKKYDVPMPLGETLLDFEKTIREIQNFEMTASLLETNMKKCEHCIYRTLCRPE